MTAFDPPFLRGCLIDLGSVILDERPALHRWFALALRALHSDGLRATPADLRHARRQSLREGASRIGARALELLGAHGGLAAQLWDQVDPWGANLYPPTSGSRAVLKRLSERCPLVLVSNTEPPARRWLEQHGLHPYFRAILLSCEIGLSKPDERIFRKALDVLDCRPADAVMIGDRLDLDIAPARRLGLWTIRVRRGPAYWQTPRSEGERPHLTVPSLRAAALKLERLL